MGDEDTRHTWKIMEMITTLTAIRREWLVTCYSERQCNVVVKSMDSETRLLGFASLPSAALGNLHDLAMPQFPHMKHGECYYIPMGLF